MYVRRIVTKYPATAFSLHSGRGVEVGLSGHTRGASYFARFLSARNLLAQIRRYLLSGNPRGFISKRYRRSRSESSRFYDRQTDCSLAFEQNFSLCNKFKALSGKKVSVLNVNTRYRSRYGSWQFQVSSTN